MIFNDTYQKIRPMESFRTIKIDIKCKHLSNFPAVTLRALFCNNNNDNNTNNRGLGANMGYNFDFGICI
jgi:hypothetical protein